MASGGTWVRHPCLIRMLSTTTLITGLLMVWKWHGGNHPMWSNPHSEPLHVAAIVAEGMLFSIHMRTLPCTGRPKTRGCVRTKQLFSFHSLFQMKSWYYCNTWLKNKRLKWNLWGRYSAAINWHNSIKVNGAWGWLTSTEVPVCPVVSRLATGEYEKHFFLDTLRSIAILFCKNVLWPWSHGSSQQIFDGGHKYISFKDWEQKLKYCNLLGAKQGPQSRFPKLCTTFSHTSFFMSSSWDICPLFPC